MLLRKSDRGKRHDASSLPLDYGVVKVAEGVDGAELLEAYERGDIQIDSDGKAALIELSPSPILIHYTCCPR